MDLITHKMHQQKQNKEWTAVTTSYYEGIAAARFAADTLGSNAYKMVLLLWPLVMKCWLCERAGLSKFCHSSDVFH